MAAYHTKISGNVMVEYGLIGALVILIIVPAVGLLGDGLRTFYGDAGALSGAEKLFGLLDANGGAHVAVTSPAVSTSLGEGLSQLQAYGGPMSLRMNNGSLEVGLPNGASMAISNTGAEGGAMSVAVTSMLADQFLRLADEFEGEVDDGLIALARQLANKGHLLADAEESYNNAPAPEQTESVRVAHYEYAHAHQELINLIKAYPGYDANSGEFTDSNLRTFHDSLNFYGEGIDTVAQKNYLEGVGGYSNVDSGLDVDVSEITIDMAPVFTHKTSERIALARQETQQSEP